MKTGESGKPKGSLYTGNIQCNLLVDSTPSKLTYCIDWYNGLLSPVQIVEIHGATEFKVIGAKNRGALASPKFQKGSGFSKIINPSNEGRFLVEHVISTHQATELSDAIESDGVTIYLDGLKVSALNGQQKIQLPLWQSISVKKGDVFQTKRGWVC